MRFPALVEAIYEAALRPAGWQTVVRESAALLNARDGGIATYNFETGAYAIDSLPIDPDYTRRYNERWVHRNFLWQATHTLPVGQLFSFEAAMPRAAFEDTAFYNEWWRPQGMTRALGANLVATTAVSSVATFHRPSNRPNFDRRDAARFRALLPHLCRAMEVRQRLEADQGVAEDFRASLEELRKPALLVDAECRIQFANSVAGRLLSAGELRATAGGSIVTRRAEQTRMVHRLVSDVLVNASSGGRLVVQRSNARPLTLLISPLHRSASPFARRSALILIDDPEQDERGDAPATLLHALYRLTKSEAQLAVLVAGGNRLRQAAEQRGICLATARTHLAHIFQKTGVASQGELIRLLIASGIVSSVGPFG